MKITVSLKVIVEENDGDANLYGMTKVGNCTDNPLQVAQETRGIANAVLIEVIRRVDESYRR